MDAEPLREALSETEQHIADGERRLIAEQHTLAKDAAERKARYAAEVSRLLLLLFDENLSVNDAERHRILRKLYASRH